ncbi:MAG: adenylyl-sulfate kinase [Bacteroidales bacterium]|nr:adenylyl-sulfate kinase [Bacteroidales bacterium]
MKGTNIYPIFDKTVQRSERETLLRQKGCVVWFTGLSGSGKSTLAIALERALLEKGYLCQLLDGDNIRSGINNNLGFSEEDRKENIRRIAEVAKLFVQCGVITLTAFISPTNEIRALATKIIGRENFVEVFVDTPLDICELRDVKGLYKKARAGEIKEFTGISSPFEAPVDPDLTLDTSRLSVEESVELLMNTILPKIKIKS